MSPARAASSSSWRPKRRHHPSGHRSRCSIPLCRLPLSRSHSRGFLPDPGASTGSAPSGQRPFRSVPGLPLSVREETMGALSTRPIPGTLVVGPPRDLPIACAVLSGESVSDSGNCPSVISILDHDTEADRSHRQAPGIRRVLAAGPGSSVRDSMEPNSVSGLQMLPDESFRRFPDRSLQSRRTSGGPRYPAGLPSLTERLRYFGMLSSSSQRR